MSHAVHRVHHSYRDYLSVADDSTVKLEYLDGQICAMAGDTPEQAALAEQMSAKLAAALASGRCRVYSSDPRIRVLATGLATYPDVSVVCGPRTHDPEDKNSVVNPIVLVEVTGKSTEESDRGEKFDHCRRIPALQEYVLVSYRERAIDVRRCDARGEWATTVAGAGERIELQSIDRLLDVDAIYEGAANPPE
ncbi:MAG: Uma2 family endonuclease [Myxococcales bacterium]|nr:Uma2 family endonuclease [Myxococcales bacterium]